MESARHCVPGATVHRTPLVDEEIREAYIKLVDVQDDRVVAFIEVLSPSNKYRGAAGQKSYRDKRHEVMNSSSHFVEIDLLRRGERMHTKEGLPRLRLPRPPSQVDARPRGRLWPIRVQERLPAFEIPLRQGETTTLDLQCVLDTAYERAAYDMVVRYDRDADPPLEGEGAVWAGHLLRERGLRNGS